MQKLITVTVDIAVLQAQSEGPFSVQEIDAVGRLLSEGWNIESWEFVTGDGEASKAVILMLLNDGVDGAGYEDSFYELDEDDFEDAEGDGAPEAEEEDRTGRSE